MKSEDYTHRVTRWLNLGNEEFFDRTTKRIKENQGDRTCTKTDGNGRVALFRTADGISLKGKKYTDEYRK
tara:strand:- start:312 stop:521 length:210 start_codon:yes stop_codon:yes gene_type:complete